MDDMAAPFISLQNVSKGFESKSSKIEILKNTDLDIYKGETIAITGASGIGKSTLLNLIGTLDTPDSGRILFDSNDLIHYRASKLAALRNRRIGFVFQFHYLLKGFTALENIMMPCLIGGTGKKGVEKKALNMLERVGLSLLSSHRIEDLSGGEQQRVALARALVNDPEVLLADEPTGNLDQDNSTRVHQLMNQLNKELGTTVIVVTHNNELAKLMDRNVTLNNGKIEPVT